MQNQIVFANGGTAPEQVKLGYRSLGITVKGTKETLAKTFEMSGSICLVEGAQIGQSDEYEYLVMILDQQQDCTSESTDSGEDKAFFLSCENINQMPHQPDNLIIIASTEREALDVAKREHGNGYVVNDAAGLGKGILDIS